MAVVQAYTSILMDGSGDGEVVELFVEETSADRIVLSNGFYTEIYEGQFSYDYWGEPYGRLEEVSAFGRDDLWLRISGIGRDANITYQYALEGDDSGFYSYLLSGNDLVIGSYRSDILKGFAGNDRLEGRGGNNVLLGDAGNDRLIGGAGTDRLDGGSGVDLMQGFAGDDFYIVDSVRDRVAENFGEGTDLVTSSAHHALRANVENLFLSGSDAINGTGNTEANEIRGNGAANLLNGGAGDDFILGGGGNDRIVAGAGVDRVAGGAGADVFLFTNVENIGNGAARDTVLDLRRGDLLHLAAIDADTQTLGNQAFQFVATSTYSGAGAELRYIGGILSGDVDADGRDDFQIALANGTALAASDILL